MSTRGIFLSSPDGAINTCMKLQDLMIEAPVVDYTPLGDFAQPGSFTTTKYDPALVQSPRARAKVFTAFEKAPYKFRFYAVNIPGARRYTETGPVTEKWLNIALPQLGAEIKQRPVQEDEICVFYLSNVGAQKVPFTPWIMAHRLGHAIRKNNYAWIEYEGYWAEQRRQILEQYYEIHETTYTASVIANALGTMKSARDGKITRPYEFLYELLAQYLIQGTVRLNPLPKELGGVFARPRVFGRPSIGIPLKHEPPNSLIPMLERDLNHLLNDVLVSCEGKIFVM
jgi:hypothetical protein